MPPRPKNPKPTALRPAAESAFPPPDAAEETPTDAGTPDLDPAFFLSYAAMQMDTRALAEALLAIMDSHAWRGLGLLSDARVGQTQQDLPSAQVAIDCFQALLEKIGPGMELGRNARSAAAPDRLEDELFVAYEGVGPHFWPSSRKYQHGRVPSAERIGSPFSRRLIYGPAKRRVGGDEGLHTN